MSAADQPDPDTTRMVAGAEHRWRQADIHTWLQQDTFLLLAGDDIPFCGQGGEEWLKRLSRGTRPRGQREVLSRSWDIFLRRGCARVVWDALG